MFFGIANKKSGVKTYMLDVDCTDKNTDNIAKAVQHSLKRLFGDKIGNVPIIIFGQCTNSGGGGTGQKLYRTLDGLGVTSELYLVTSYSLHNIQTALRNGVQLVLGEGGLDNDKKGKLNAIQLFHGVYNLQNFHKHEELTDIYLYI